MFFHSLRYLGIEGWVPQMYLKKLGDVKRSGYKHYSAEMFPTNQLRSAIEEELKGESMNKNKHL